MYYTTNSLFKILNDLDSINETLSVKEYYIHENDENYFIEVELPRFKKENISIKVIENTLKITAEREEGDIKFWNNKKTKTKFAKEFSLGEKINKKGITSKFEDGLLEITIPKIKNVDDEITVEVK
jgi:HSP20 family protein